MNLQAVTQHAAERCKEREIPEAVLPLVREYGSPRNSDGRGRLRFDKRALSAAGAAGVSPELLCAARGVVIVLENERVVTAWRDEIRAAPGKGGRKRRWETRAA